MIESAGNKGIWTRDIRFKCNLMMTEVNRILKTLESKKLIKAVKSVAVGTYSSLLLLNRPIFSAVVCYYFQEIVSSYLDFSNYYLENK